MTLFYVVLCDLAGETFPVAVCPTFDLALRLREKLTASTARKVRDIVNMAKGKDPRAIPVVLDDALAGVPVFRVAEAPFAEMDSVVEVLLAQGRRGIRLRETQ